MKRMHRMISAGLLICLFIGILAVRADGPKTEMVKFPSGKDTIDGFLAVPEKPGRYPAVIVIHEWWGLNDWVKEQGAKISDLGYVTLAIDLYRGKVATTPEEAHEIMRGVPEDRAKRDLHAAVEFLSAQPNVKKDRLGAIGWCMGGGYSLNVALQEPTLKADVINYGHLATDPESIAKINASVLGFFGAQDRGISVDDVKKFEQALKQQGKKAEIIIYPDAGHGFENPNNKDGYRPQAAADAWSRMDAFFKRTLQ